MRTYFPFLMFFVFMMFVADTKAQKQVSLNTDPTINVIPINEVEHSPTNLIKNDPKNNGSNKIVEIDIFKVYNAYKIPVNLNEQSFHSSVSTSEKEIKQEIIAIEKEMDENNLDNEYQLILKKQKQVLKSRLKYFKKNNLLTQ